MCQISSTVSGCLLSCFVLPLAPRLECNGSSRSRPPAAPRHFSSSIPGERKPMSPISSHSPPPIRRRSGVALNLRAATHVRCAPLYRGNVAPQPGSNSTLWDWLDFGERNYSRFCAGCRSPRPGPSAYRTMLRNDAYWFSRLGLPVERADNTARILDAKYHLLLPETERKIAAHWK